MKKLCAFIIPALLFLAVMAGCGGPESAVTSIRDAEHARLGVMVGSNGEAMAKARFPNAEVKSFDNIMEAVTAMEAGQLDAIVTSLPTAMNLVRRNSGFAILPESLDEEEICIALQKGNPEMRNHLNSILLNLENDGTLAEMRERWFKLDSAPYADKSPTLPQKGWVLKVGVAATREPVSFVRSDGRISGFDAELARRIGAKLDRPVKFINMNFGALIPALQSGKVDLVISCMAATDERRQSVDFTDSYLNSRQVLVVRQDALGGKRKLLLSSPGDLRDKRVGVVLGSSHDAYATENFPDGVILRFKSPSDMIVAVKAGRVDAGIYTEAQALGFSKVHPDLGILMPALVIEPVSMGFNKEDELLREEFNSFLKEMRESGLYDDIVKRWVAEAGTEMPELPPVSGEETLTVGLISDLGLPYAVVKDGRLVGLDVEITERFGRYLGRKVVYMDMDFGSLISALAMKKIDLIGMPLSMTEERKQRIDFSDPYFQESSIAFALKENLARYQEKKVSAATGRIRMFFSGIADSFYSNIILEKRYLLLLSGLRVTVVISVFATILGTLLGGLICFARMNGRRVLNLPARVYISIMRGVPVLVLLMIIFYVVFASVNISPVLVSILAFGLNFAAYAAEIFRSGIQGIDRGQTEAGIAMGFTRVGAFRTIILPQTVHRVLPVYKGEFISMMKATSIVGYIAVQDLTKASDIIRSRTFDAFFPLFMVAALYFGISWLLIRLMDYLARRTDPRVRRRRRAAR